MIVFDSSTLILLAKAGLLDVFLGDYKGKVLVPRGVEVESCGGRMSFDALLIGERIKEKKISVANIRDESFCERLMNDFRIARGEAEALVLAIEKKSRLFASDDRNAIKACKLLRIPFTTALALLVRMKERGVVDEENARTAFNLLIKYGRYGGDIIDMVKRRLKL